MAATPRRTREEEERRRGWLLMALFFGLLLIGCALYYAWLTLSGDAGGPRRIATATTPAAERTMQPERTGASALADVAARAEPETLVVEPEPEAPEPASQIVTTPAPQPVSTLPPPAPEPEIVKQAPEPEAAPAFAGPVRVFEDRRWLTTSTLSGEDEEGRAVDFTVHLLSGGRSWTFGKSDTLDVLGETAGVASLFQTDGLGDGYCTQSAVITVGAASFEGEETLNDRLAGRRARTLSRAVSAAAPACDAAPKRLIANLGEHRQSLACPGNAETCHGESAFQRPVLVIAADAKDPDVNYGQALKAAIRKHEAAGRQIFPRFQLDDYTRFDVSL
ncbi:MAG: hypothetical protein AAFQ85_02980 [Pseudomonadota bacterium]